MLAHSDDQTGQETGLLRSSALFLSQRGVAQLVAYCVPYEFEDVFAAMTEAERIDVKGLANLKFCRRMYKLARFGLGSRTLARQLAPYPRNRVMLQRDFDLFFPVFNHSFELYSLEMIPNWRQRCRTAACFITEIRLDLLPGYLLELLSDFDHIFVGAHHNVDDVTRITGRPCTYLPLAVDVLRFAPTSLDQPRPIEICNIGRRSAITHHALLEEVDQNQMFYYYDTVAASGVDLKQRTFRVESADEHRHMLAMLLKNSRYYIANRGYVNVPELTEGYDDISARFYEGAAAGTIMIGEAPKTVEFKQQFDWPDAVIHLPFDSPDVGRFLQELNSDPERLRAIRWNNVREAAARHDWLYRIQVVFDTLGLPYTEKMQARARRLDQIVAQSTLS